MDPEQDLSINPIQDDIRSTGLSKLEDGVSRNSDDSYTDCIVQADAINDNINSNLKEQSVQSVTNKSITHCTTDGKDEINNCMDKQLISTPVKMDPLVPPPEIEISEIICDGKSCKENFDTKLAIDTELKPFIDDENNSDIQDDEIQLRWDDDDDDELNIGCEEIQDSGNAVICMKENDSCEVDVKDSPEEQIDMEVATKTSFEGTQSNKNIKEDLEVIYSPKNYNEEDNVEPKVSVLDTSVEIITEHGLNKPDMMLEIPSEELVEFTDDEDDGPDLLSSLEMSPDDVGIELCGTEDVQNMKHTGTNISVNTDATINVDEQQLKKVSDNESLNIVTTINNDLLNVQKMSGNELLNTESIINKNIHSEKQIVNVSLNIEEAIIKDEQSVNIISNIESLGTGLLINDDTQNVKQPSINESFNTNATINKDNQTVKQVDNDELISNNATVNEDIKNVKQVSNSKPLNTDATINDIQNVKQIGSNESFNTDASIGEVKMVMQVINSESLNTDATMNEDIQNLKQICKNESLNTDININEDIQNVKHIDNELLNTNATLNENVKNVEQISMKEALNTDATDSDDLPNEKKINNNPSFNSDSTFNKYLLNIKQGYNELLRTDAITASNMDIKSENKSKDTVTIERQADLDFKSSDQRETVTKCSNISIELICKNQVELNLETTPLQEITESNQQQDKQTCSLDSEQKVTDVMDEPQPSTSQACMIMEMRRDSDEVGEVSDSLGLLAESTRVLEYDEEQEDDDDGDDDEEFDQDEESSNQMIADYSEDSNAVQLETDLPKNVEMEIDNAQDSTEKELSETSLVKTMANEDCELQICDVMSVDVSSKNEKDTKTDIELFDQSPVIKPSDNAEAEEEISDKIIQDAADEAIEQTTADTAQCRILKSLLSEDNDDCKTHLSKMEDEQVNEPKLLGSQSQDKIQNKDSINEENVVLLESSSEDDFSETKETTSKSRAEAETPITSEDVSRSSLLTEMNEKYSSDSNLESKEQEDGVMDEPKISVKEMLKASMGLEVFNVDSDDDEVLQKVSKVKTQEELDKLRGKSKCVNTACKSPVDAKYYVADSTVLTFYESDRKKKAVVCEPCAEEVAKRNEKLINGMKTFMPLLELETSKCKQDLVEISDSESEEDEVVGDDDKETIGEAGAKLLEEQLADMINETWKKFKMDFRLKDAEVILQHEIDRLNKENKEIDDMLNECQVATDKLRNELYATFEQERKEIPPIVINDTSNLTYSCYEENAEEKLESPQTRMKRRMSTISDTPAKKLAVLTGQSTTENEVEQEIKPASKSPDSVDDDNVEVSVVKLSAEAAPADLPPPGEVTRPPLRVGMTVYAMRNAFGLWLKAKIVETQAKNSSSVPFTMCRVRFEHKVNKNPFKLLPARCLAYSEPADVRLTIGTRIIASSDKRGSFYSGVVAEVPNPVNNYRYLVFFDDGHAKYAQHVDTRLVCECSPLVWEEVHPYSRDFVRQYLLSYPERPMVRLHPRQNLKTEWNGKWWTSKVMQVDASLALIKLAGDRLEWIYRGSTRLAPLYLELQAAERHRTRPMPRSGPQHRTNMPYVEYTRYDEEQPSKSPAAQTPQQNEEIRRQRAVAKKSTTTSQPPAPVPVPAPPSSAANLDNVTSRVVYYTPKNAIRPHKMVPHTCGPKCRRTDVLALKDLRTYNPLAKPLLSGWERQIVRFKGHKEVMYRAPCGRRLRCMPELHRYLRAVRSDLSVDLFDFAPATHCLAEFVLNKCLVGKKDLSHGKENVPVPCVNYYDESLPEFCSYNTERTPTAGVPLNIDPEFLCGCDCEDDCEDKTKCACWKMTLEGARTIGLDGDVGYVYRRLPEPLPSGIYECNSRCKCKNTCLNRVAQHPLQLKLQVFKTLNRGWGIRALNDVPKGAFLCVYAGNLLTDATANLDGLNEGDEYLAELDYIEVVEQMKEGFEEDIPEFLKEPERRTSAIESVEEEETSSEEEEVRTSKDERDDDFRPGYIEMDSMEFSKRLRTRERRKKERYNNFENKDKEKDKQKEKRKDTEKEEGEKDNGDEDCITISDDEEVREPSRFTAQAGMDSNQLVSKYRSVRSYFGKDEACYIMDAKVQGNIGRYLNHSCCPNVFVQNVFVDTHDPRFPWVAFFALSHIRAGTELTWNYNYDVGSVPGKILYCYCGAVNCRGRLL
ncbi:unnamed protein product [Parnassius apollo]|uniref:(apollo) hypothetical protein n=1 Tax=Parnassius apollo TaxID=110799 RepID=A0A8S3WA56_PARAO|nr:unnamed protein product [Parnassius apollo]